MGDIMAKIEQDTLENEELCVQKAVFDKWRVDDEEDYIPLSDVQLFNELRQKVSETPKHVYLRKLLIALNKLNYEKGKTKETDHIWNSLLDLIETQTNSSKAGQLSSVQKSKIANSKKIMKNCFCFNKFKKKKVNSIGVNTETVQTKTMDTMTDHNTKPSVNNKNNTKTTTSTKSRVLKQQRTENIPTSPPRNSLTSPSKRGKISIYSTPKNSRTLHSPSVSPVNKTLSSGKCPEKSSVPMKPTSSNENRTLSPIQGTPISYKENFFPVCTQKISVNKSSPSKKLSASPYTVATSTPIAPRFSSSNSITRIQTPSSSVTNSTNYYTPLTTPSVQNSQLDASDHSRMLSSSTLSCCCNCHSILSETVSSQDLTIPPLLRLPPIHSAASQPNSVPSTTSHSDSSVPSIPPPPPMPSIGSLAP
ncbi:hypothetical protein WDU94_001025, partial [Cyamophila willieti]